MASTPHRELTTARIRIKERLLASTVGSVHSTLACIHGVRSVAVSLDDQEAAVRFDLYEVNPFQFKRALFIVGLTVKTITLSFDLERNSPHAPQTRTSWPP